MRVLGVRKSSRLALHEKDHSVSKGRRCNVNSTAAVHAVYQDQLSSLPAQQGGRHRIAAYRIIVLRNLRYGHGREWRVENGARR